MSLLMVVNLLALVFLHYPIMSIYHTVLWAEWLESIRKDV